MWDYKFTVFGLERGVEPEPGTEYPRLPAGNSEFPFKFYFPNNPNLPPSMYNYSHGRIQYTLKAYIDIIGWLDYNTDKFYLNFEPISLIVAPDLLQPELEKDENELSTCCCFPQGRIEASIKCSRAVMKNTPFLIELSLHNLSDKVDITGVTVKLYREDIFRAGYHTKTVGRIICDMQDVPNSEIKRSNNEPRSITFQYFVSRDALISFQGQLMSSTYDLSVNVHLSGAHSKIRFLKSVVVGNESPSPAASAPAYSDAMQDNFRFSLGQTLHPQEFSSNLPRYEEICERNQ